jgi:tetratricopeptide (TPR) repeat protein
MYLFKKSFYLLFSLIFLSGTGCAYYNTLFNAKKSFNAGIEIIQKEPEKESHPNATKYFEDTIDKCWKLIELYSDKSKYADDALLYIVKSEYNLGKYAQARSHADQFVKKYPNSDLIPEANLWYGKLLLKDNQIDDGKEYLYKVINFESRSRLKAEAYYELGNIAYENEDFTGAIDFFNQALKEKVDKQYAAFINFYLGESYFHQNEFKKAIQQYSKVEKFSPSLDVEYRTKFNMGKSQAEIGKSDEALKTFRKMLTAPRFKNFYPFIKTEIATIYNRQNKTGEAIELYKEVVQEKIPSGGTALASYKLAQIYERSVQNIDSAVFYYGDVKKIYAKFDSVEKAEEKYLFLSELKNIRDNIKRDKYLVFKLENDSHFKDSLYTAQYEDSIYRILGEKPTSTMDTLSLKIDTTSYLFLKNIVQLDSLKKFFADSLAKAKEDTLITRLQDSLNVINRYMIYKTPKTEERVEKRKLPQIKEDLKENKFQLAEFFLLQTENYDSAIVQYQNFLKDYSDSLRTPKAIYSLYYIYDTPNYRNPARRDSLKNILLSDYSNSPFARAILKKEGRLQEGSDQIPRENMEHSLFLKAESLYYAQNLDSALDMYKKVAGMDTATIWAAKAQLAVSWIYEKDFKNIEKAVQEYTELKENYNQPQFIALADKKIRPPSQTDLAEIDNQIPGADTVSFAQAIADSAVEKSTSESDSSAGLASSFSQSLPSVNKTKDYRDWRINRAKKD